MSVSYGKGDRGRATRLHGEVVRSRGECQNCGSTHYIQTAHIISRVYSATRTDERNALCLCARCHRYFSVWPLEFYKFIRDLGLLEEYEEMRARAELKHPVDWAAEVERLLNRKKELADETDCRLPGPG